MLGTDFMDDRAELLHSRAEPLEVVRSDPVVLGVSRLYIGFLQKAEPAAGILRIVGPDIDQARVQPTPLFAEVLDIVAVRGVEGTGQQTRVITALRRLVELEGSILEKNRRTEEGRGGEEVV